MIKKITAKSYLILGVLSFLSLFALTITENTKITVKKEWFNEKIGSAMETKKAFKILKEHRFEEGIFVDDVNDPNQTVMIGQEFTLITTTYGDLDAKLTSTNPNFSAVIIELLKNTGLKKGDYIAVGLTGSFPALNIAAIIAMETLDLRPVIITSVGSSSWGANDPYFTWLDMENVLFSAGIIRSTSVASSIGGGDDRGMGLSPAGREFILEAIKRNGKEFIENTSLSEGISQRMEIYKKKTKGIPVKAYLNIGGGVASIGSSSDAEMLPPGIVENLPKNNYSSESVASIMLQKKIPVLNLHNIKTLARKYSIPINPRKLPEPGTGALYRNIKYNTLIVSIFTIILMLIIFLVYYLEMKFNRPENNRKTEKI